jgi:hypothetical protein
VDGQTSH